MFQHILVPLDGSPRAERAIPVAARLAQASGGTVMLLQAVSLSAECLLPYAGPDPRTLQIIIDADLAEARNYLETITHLSNLCDVHTVVVVILGQPAETILSVVETYHNDLIVLIRRLKGKNRPGQRSPKCAWLRSSGQGWNA